jgi:putative ABC transport system permease protein
MFDGFRVALRRLLRRDRFEREMTDELPFHLEARIEDLVRRGVAPDDARRRARIEFGGVDQYKERLRAARRGSLLDAVAQDVRLSVRRMRREPTFAVAVAATLSIGIGASTAVFGVASATLVSRIPYEGAERLAIGGSSWNGSPELGHVSGLDYFDYRESSRSFDDLAAFNPFPMPATVTGVGEPWEVQTGFVTWNLLRTLRVAPLLGRSFLPAEETQADARVVLIGFAVWQSRFGGARDVVGRTLVLDGDPQTIIGVLPPGLRFVGVGRRGGGGPLSTRPGEARPSGAEIWRVVARPGEARDLHNYHLAGRLRPGVSLAQAQRDVDAISRTLERDYPDSNKDKGLRLTSLQQYIGGDVRAGILLPAAATACLLLIACANVAGLMLARGQRRMGDVAMRAALGASRMRLVRQCLTESIVLTLPAGAIGVAAAYVLQGLLFHLLPVEALSVTRPTVDGLLLLFTVCMSLVTGLLVGIVPAIRGTRTTLSPHIGTGRQADERRPGTRLRGALVVAQIAVSTVLLVGAGLVARSLVRLTAVDFGFTSNRLLSARVDIQAPAYPDRARRQAFYAAVLSEIAALPGVASVGATTQLPILDPGNTWRIRTPDRPAGSDSEMQPVRLRRVSPGYFATMGMGLLAGRDISAADRDTTPAVAVVSESLARALYPGRDPIGRVALLQNTLSRPPGEVAYEIVGVVRSARLASPRDEADPAMYLSIFQASPRSLRLVVRTSGDPSTAATPLRQIVARHDRNALVTGVQTMDAVVEGAFADFRRVAGYLALFAGVALLLAAVGLYGALAYHVSQQQHEIGVRLALGANRASVLGMVLRRGGSLVTAGLVVGLAAAQPGTQLVGSLLFETARLDPVTYSGAAVALGFVAAVACLVPALRATRVDPVDVLRSE